MYNYADIHLHFRNLAKTSNAYERRLNAWIDEHRRHTSNDSLNTSTTFDTHLTKFMTIWHMNKVKDGKSTNNREQLKHLVRSLSSSPTVANVSIPNQLRTLFDENGRPKPIVDTTTILRTTPKVRNALRRWARVSHYTDYDESGDDDDDAVTTWNTLMIEHESTNTTTTSPTPQIRPDDEHS